MAQILDIQACHPGSRVFVAGEISVLLKPPTVAEFDLFVDMNGRKPADARRSLLAGSILYPQQEELARLLERKPALGRKLSDLIIDSVSPDSVEPVGESEAHPNAQVFASGAQHFHLRPATEAEYEKFEAAARTSPAAAATHLLKACMVEPDPIAFDRLNAEKPGLKHTLAAHLMRMAGADLEFTEKK